MDNNNNNKFSDEKKAFGDAYMDLMECCYKNLLDYPSATKPSYINLSTMTIICKLTQPVDILSLSDNFKSPNDILCIIKRPKQHKEYDVSKRGKKTKTFFNQASIHFKTHTQKCVKVFSNGRLHLTGITSINEASNVCVFICNLLNSTLGAITGSKSVDAYDLKICMINTNFSLNHGIDILKLKKCLSELNDINCQYTPDTYPGLKIKCFITNASVFIFSSGQIVITGVKSLNDIQIIYSKILCCISSNFHTVFAKCNINNKKNKKITSIQFGYPTNIIQPCSLSQN